MTLLTILVALIALILVFQFPEAAGGVLGCLIQLVVWAVVLGVIGIGLLVMFA